MGMAIARRQVTTGSPTEQRPGNMPGRFFAHVRAPVISGGILAIWQPENIHTLILRLPGRQNVSHRNWHSDYSPEFGYRAKTLVVDMPACPSPDGSQIKKRPPHPPVINWFCPPSREVANIIKTDTLTNHQRIGCMVRANCPTRPTGPI